MSNFGLEFVKKLRPCKWRYVWPLDDGVEHFGFIAQEVDEIASHKEYGFVLLGDDQTYRINPGEFIGPLVKSVQELTEEVDKLKRQLEEKGVL